MAKKASLGIFQGGGVKVAAFVGAMKCVYQENYEFKAVAGTSGGAIIAGFIAAGFTHQEIESKLMSTDFKKLISGTEKHHHIKNNKKWYRKPLNVGNFFWEKFRAFNQLGMFSSYQIQHWLNEEFKKKLNITDTFVTFKDLKMPLIVIATELVNGKHKVWSNYTTPDSSVAKAIRASCTIPIFFQPVLEDTSVYVDGGVISNLPISISLNEFKNNYKSHDINHVLGFHIYTKSDSSIDFPWGITKYFFKLTEAIVNGNVQLQKLFKPENVNLIPIEISGIKTTDFDKMGDEVKKRLIEEGAKQVKDHLNTKDIISFDRYKDDILFYEAEFFTKLQHILTNAKKNIIIVVDNLKWVFEVVITLIYIRTKGINVKIVYRGDNTPSRLEFLKSIGCQVAIISSSEKQGNYNCVIADGDNINIASLILLNANSINDGVYATVYDKSFHYEIINRFLKNLNEITHRFPSTSTFTPSIVKISTSELETKLRLVDFYSSERVTLRLAEIDLSKTIPHQNHIKKHKLQQVEVVRNIFNEMKLNFYDAIAVTLKNGKKSLIIPPVVELKKDNMFHVAEGHSRIYFSRTSTESKVLAVVVENLDDKLPAPATTWDEMEMINKSIAPEELYKLSDPSKVRNIDSKTHYLSDWVD